MLEKQADLIRYYKEANETLNKKVFDLTSQYRATLDPNWIFKIVDWNHFCAAYEIRTKHYFRRISWKTFLHVRMCEMRASVEVASVWYFEFRFFSFSSFVES